MKIEDYEDQIQSSVNVVFWNRMADSVTEILNKAKGDGKLEEVKHRLNLLVDGCLEGYKEEDFKDEEERAAFVRFRDVIKNVI
jgi:hypothetical protein